MFVKEEVFQLERSWLKLVAISNILYMFVTDSTFQLFSGWLNTDASLKAHRIVVALDVFCMEKSMSEFYTSLFTMMTGTTRDATYPMRHVWMVE